MVPPTDLVIRDDAAYHSAMTVSPTPRSLDHALARHGAKMDADEFLAILAEATDSTDTLTADEQALLIDNGGVSRAAVAPEQQAIARRQIVVQSVRADAEAARDGFTTSEVADRFGIAPSNIRRDVARRGLYVAGRTRRREHVFPRWQFTAEGPLPGLREVLGVIPEDYHPLDVAAFMATPNETLGDRSPVEWLASGGDPRRVVQIVDELGRV